MDSHLALVKWVGETEKNLHSVGVPIKWIKAFDVDKFVQPLVEDEDDSYVIEWRKGKKPTKGWKAYDGIVLAISDDINFLETEFKSIRKAQKSALLIPPLSTTLNKSSNPKKEVSAPNKGSKMEEKENGGDKKKGGTSVAKMILKPRSVFSTRSSAGSVLQLTASSEEQQNTKTREHSQVSRQQDSPTPREIKKSSLRDEEQDKSESSSPCGSENDTDDDSVDVHGQSSATFITKEDLEKALKTSNKLMLNSVKDFFATQKTEEEPPKNQNIVHISDTDKTLVLTD